MRKELIDLKRKKLNLIHQLGESMGINIIPTHKIYYALELYNAKSIEELMYLTDGELMKAKHIKKGTIEEVRNFFKNYVEVKDNYVEIINKFKEDYSSLNN